MITSIEIKPKIRALTTYSVPIIHGTVRYEDKKLHSYSVYKKNKKEEVIFKDEKVALYEYDSNHLLASKSIFDSNGKLENIINFRVCEKNSDTINIEDWSNKDKSPNIGYFDRINETGNWNLFFSRVYSNLGYKISVEYIVNKDDDCVEERHFQFDKKQKQRLLKAVFVHDYQYHEMTLDIIHRYIFDHGWNISREMSDYLTSQ